MLCASRELRRGQIRRFDFGGHPIVLFRGRETGVVHALPAHCAHQGADLGHGTVVGDRLRCPLHHWEYSNRCERIPGSLPGSINIPSLPARYQAAERFGMLFLHLGGEPESSLPGFSVDDGELSFRAGRPVTIDCPWFVVIANAFDMTHLQTVHRRTLTSEVEIHSPDRMTFHVRYTTAVIGDAWSDRVMRALSGNDIRVQVTCSGGGILFVESQIGRRRGYLMVGLRPTATGVFILPLFGVRRGMFDALHARVAAALFTAFLRRDIKPLDGIRFPLAISTAATRPSTPATAISATCPHSRAR